MQIKEKLSSLYNATNNKFNDHFGFKIEDVTFGKLVDYLHAPKDSSSLAVTRILFGLAMLLDIPDERGGASMEQRWDAEICHFPLFPFIQPIPMPYMAAVYAGLWLGALGIMLGYKYRYSAATFTACYWYLFLIEKSHWNNHSYLFGLVALLLSCTEANCYWSIDVLMDESRCKLEVPYWNYFILKYQFFILYFMAGLKKGTAEWLTGFSVQNLSEHWVFGPFKLFLTVPQTDYLIVHWFVFMFDLSVALWMMCARTRHAAMLVCALFHLMNSRLFRIGMFPWVCLATMPLFYPFDWPKKILIKVKEIKHNVCSIISVLKEIFCIQNTDKSTLEAINEKYYFINDVDDTENNEFNEHNDVDDNLQDNDFDEIINKNEGIETPITPEIHDDERFVKQSCFDKKKLTVYFIILHVLSQAFLPYSHFITKGYNNWTNGLYGYSWDMMVHTWETHAVVLQIVDNENNKEFFMDPYTYAPNDRWTRHGDMVYQYATCLKDILLKDAEEYKVDNKRLISDNISIYIDVWCSLNGRFTQRMFDPKVDILRAGWKPFEDLPFLMPLLDEALDWRDQLEKMKEDVHSWNNHSDVIFMADFPGYEQEKYISEELQNITLIVLKGDVVYQPEVTENLNGYSVLLTSGDRISVERGIFHKVQIIGAKPSFYMYTFFNSTEVEKTKELAKLPVFDELYVRFHKTYTFGKILIRSLFQMFFGFTNCP